ncbi:DUF3037 domain-containing protein [Halomonas sp. ND22Bw]|uniref:DUF3037 domain-containing protein n=1 Tax=Halomonas sp. ND22Bw TaxID=2054178 RepID=UPI000D0B0303|nr:DUF3037 domain-containing protein [Halomonas sp. ND22Bw]
MSTICNYAVLRFQPYPETGEFANLGVVMLCSDGTFLYRLETRHYKRITQFFSKLDKKVLLNARRGIADELARISDVMKSHAHDSELQLSVFKHLTSPTETILRFSRPGVIAAAKPEDALEKLFLNYVHHEFDNKPDAEQQLTQRVNRLLKNLPNRHYDRGTLTAGYYKVTFPFLWKDNSTTRQAIKPISFDLEDPSSIIEKGDKWISKMERLIAAGAAPSDAVFISRQPEANGPRLKAYREVVRELESKPHIRLLPDNMGQQAIQKAIAETPAAMH